MHLYYVGGRDRKGDGGLRPNKKDGGEEEKGEESQRPTGRRGIQEVRRDREYYTSVIEITGRRIR